MKKYLCFLPLLAICLSCSKSSSLEPDTPPIQDNSLENLARLLSCLPLESEQLSEVYDAVNSSSVNGYDEEYLMKDLLLNPGSGVGDNQESKSVKRSQYKRPIRVLMEEFLSSGEAKSAFHLNTKSNTSVEDYFNSLIDSGLQIYWPYSEDWDGETFPIITFNPGYGAESNYGYKLSIGEGGARIVDSVYVDENVALKTPVWVINTNDDSAFSPLDLIVRQSKSAPRAGSSDKNETLTLKSFTMLRNYDSWFAGASEFFIKCGAVNGFKATTEDELLNYTPSVTDMMVVVKRKYKGIPLDVHSILVSSFTSQMENVAFIITEDDGGTSTSWKCSAKVTIKSKSYGFDIDIPYKDKDDLVWRGQLSSEYLHSSDIVSARLGDVIVDFEMK